jgi:hypothetical protein
MGGVSGFSGCSQHEIPKHKCFQHHSGRRGNATSLEVERIILLPKQGAKDDLNTSRPTILLPNVYKLSSKVLTRRLCQMPDGKQTPQQAVFH